MKCPRTLDKPILLFGLEMEDIALLSLITGVTGLIIGPMVPGIFMMVGWMALIRIKRDKPEGYLIHLLYKHGFEFKGLLPPVNKINRYSVLKSQRKGHGTSF